jgi:transcriptional regulator with XRE-family HTH domain
MLGEQSESPLAAYRRRHGLTLRQVAEKLGVAWETVWRWEHVDQRPPGRLLEMTLRELEGENRRYLVAAELLNGAYRRLSDRARWAPHDVIAIWALDGDGQPVRFNDASAERWTALAAIARESWERREGEGMPLAAANDAYINALREVLEGGSFDSLDDVNKYRVALQALSRAEEMCRARGEPLVQPEQQARPAETQ